MKSKAFWDGKLMEVYLIRKAWYNLKYINRVTRVCPIKIEDNQLFNN